jgi:hypothetical protein
MCKNSVVIPYIQEPIVHESSKHCFVLYVSELTSKWIQNEFTFLDFYYSSSNVVKIIIQLIICYITTERKEENE